MDIVEIPLLNYVVRFRKLGWKTELRASFKGAVDPRVELLALALVDVSGRADISLDDAQRILKALPLPILQRVWVLYKAYLPDNRVFTTKRLYHAPDPRAYQKHERVVEAERDQTANLASQQMEAKFGRQEMLAAQGTHNLLLKDAKDRGLLGEELLMQSLARSMPGEDGKDIYQNL